MFYWATHELVPKLLQLPLHLLKYTESLSWCFWLSLPCHGLLINVCTKYIKIDNVVY